jgi:biopolymer transport protein ExbB/TolQ
LLAAATMAGVKTIEKKNRTAALVTMIGLNVATAAVVMNNYRNARQLAQR